MKSLIVLLLLLAGPALAQPDSTLKVAARLVGEHQAVAPGGPKPQILSGVLAALNS